MQATEVVARYEEALRRLAGDVDRLPVILEDESQVYICIITTKEMY